MFLRVFVNFSISLIVAVKINFGHIDRLQITLVGYFTCLLQDVIIYFTWEKLSLLYRSFMIPALHRIYY